MLYRIVILVEQMNPPYDTVQGSEHSVDWSNVEEAKKVAQNLADSDDF